MQKYIEEALEHGWTISEKELLPPTDFECSAWDGTYTIVTYNNNKLFVPSFVTSDDVRFFGTKINDARIQKGFKYGWKIKCTSNDNTKYYMLFPPTHFHCNGWAATFEKYVYNDNISISIPHWFFNDNVMTNGSWENMNLKRKV